MPTAEELAKFNESVNKLKKKTKEAARHLALFNVSSQLESLVNKTNARRRTALEIAELRKKRKTVQSTPNHPLYVFLSSQIDTLTKASNTQIIEQIVKEWEDILSGPKIVKSELMELINSLQSQSASMSASSRTTFIKVREDALVKFDVLKHYSEILNDDKFSLDFELAGKHCKQLHVASMKILPFVIKGSPIPEADHQAMLAASQTLIETLGKLKVVGFKRHAGNPEQLDELFSATAVACHYQLWALQNQLKSGDRKPETYDALVSAMNRVRSTLQEFSASLDVKKEQLIAKKRVAHFEATSVTYQFDTFNARANIFFDQITRKQNSGESQERFQAGIKQLQNSIKESTDAMNNMSDYFGTLELNYTGSFIIPNFDELIKRRLLFPIDDQAVALKLLSNNLNLIAKQLGKLVKSVNDASLSELGSKMLNDLNALQQALSSRLEKIIVKVPEMSLEKHNKIARKYFPNQFPAPKTESKEIAPLSQNKDERKETIEDDETEALASTEKVLQKLNIGNEGESSSREPEKKRKHEKAAAYWLPQLADQEQKMKKLHDGEIRIFEAEPEKRDEEQPFFLEGVAKNVANQAKEIATACDNLHQLRQALGSLPNDNADTTQRIDYQEKQQTALAESDRYTALAKTWFAEGKADIFEKYPSPLTFDQVPEESFTEVREERGEKNWGNIHSDDDGNEIKKNGIRQYVYKIHTTAIGPRGKSGGMNLHYISTDPNLLTVEDVKKKATLAAISFKHTDKLKVGKELQRKLEKEAASAKLPPPEPIWKIVLSSSTHIQQIENKIDHIKEMIKDRQEQEKVAQKEASKTQVSSVKKKGKGGGKGR